MALTVDGTLAGAAAAIAEHVVHAQVRRFGYADLDAAVAWASSQ